MTVKELIKELKKCPKDVQVGYEGCIVTKVIYEPSNKYYVDHRGSYSDVKGPYDNLKEKPLVKLW